MGKLYDGLNRSDRLLVDAIVTINMADREMQNENPNNWIQVPADEKEKDQMREGFSTTQELEVLRRDAESTIRIAKTITDLKSSRG